MLIDKKRKERFEWLVLVEGLGLRKMVKACEYLKANLHKRYFKYHRTPQNLILAIRLEHLQIKKHQKIAMKYLQELEYLLNNK